MTTPPAPTSRPPTSGAITLRVRYCECDPMGVVHHAAFAPWLEMGRTELLRGTGVTYADLERHGVFLVVTRLDLRFRRPALYDDLLEVRTRVVGGSRVKIRHDYEIRLVERSGASPDDLAQLRNTGQDLLVAADSTLACVDAGGRPQKLPDWLTGNGDVRAT